MRRDFLHLAILSALAGSAPVAATIVKIGVHGFYSEYRGGGPLYYGFYTSVTYKVPQAGEYPVFAYDYPDKGHDPLNNGNPAASYAVLLTDPANSDLGIKIRYYDLPGYEASGNDPSYGVIIRIILHLDEPFDLSAPSTSLTLRSGITSKLLYDGLGGNGQQDPYTYPYKVDGVSIRIMGDTVPATVSSLADVASLSDQGPLEVAAEPEGVPEPATWATMLLGFGAIGAAMRRRSRGRVHFA